MERMSAVAGHGFALDRYFDHAEDYKGQITFFSAGFERLRPAWQSGEPAGVLRRMVIVFRGLMLLFAHRCEFEIHC